MQQPYYLLWDRLTRNVLLDTPDEGAARAFVRDTVEAFGKDAVFHWALYHEDGSETAESATLIAEGYQLAALVGGQPAASAAP
jgi:hypothetical protein